MAAKAATQQGEKKNIAVKCAQTRCRRPVESAASSAVQPRRVGRPARDVRSPVSTWGQRAAEEQERREEEERRRESELAGAQVRHEKHRRRRKRAKFGESASLSSEGNGARRSERKTKRKKKKKRRKTNEQSKQEASSTSRTARVDQRSADEGKVDQGADTAGTDLCFSSDLAFSSDDLGPAVVSYRRMRSVSVGSAYSSAGSSVFVTADEIFDFGLD